MGWFTCVQYAERGGSWIKRICRSRVCWSLMNASIPTRDFIVFNCSIRRFDWFIEQFLVSPVQGTLQPRLCVVRRSLHIEPLCPEDSLFGHVRHCNACIASSPCTTMLSVHASGIDDISFSSPGTVRRSQCTADHSLFRS